MKVILYALASIGAVVVLLAMGAAVAAVIYRRAVRSTNDPGPLCPACAGLDSGAFNRLVYQTPFGDNTCAKCGKEFTKSGTPVEIHS